MAASPRSGLPSGCSLVRQGALPLSLSPSPCRMEHDLHGVPTRTEENMSAPMASSTVCWREWSERSWPASRFTSSSMTWWPRV